MIQKASFLLAAAFLAGTAATTSAQAVQQTPFDKFLSRVDLGVMGVGQFNKSVTGPVLPPAASNAGHPLTEDPSNTFGALVTLRYIHKPYVGFEGNYGYARYTENFTPPPGTTAGSTFGLQTNASEETLGYVVTPPHTIFGFQPVASVGAGTTKFKPTPRGGQGAPFQYRATYYYSIGLQQEFLSSHFGLRASFRQAFFLAPDFGQNYLTIKQHTISSEPGIGFYIRF